MARSLTIKNLYDKKFKTFAFDGLFEKAMGTPESKGAWIIWGAEKNGKTWGALLLADYMTRFERVEYVSAEEGTGKDFVDSCKRAKISLTNKRIHFSEYMTIEELDAKLSSRKAAKIVFIDNLTIYADELKGGAFRQLLLKHEDKLFVFLAHEEKGEPYTAAAKMCKKLAKIIIHVKGLAMHVSGRCPGGVISIDEHKASLYWGVAS